MRFWLALGAVVVWTAGARAAELPSKLRDPRHEPPKAQTCEIDGEKGYALPGGGCVRVGGYVSVGRLLIAVGRWWTVRGSNSMRRWLLGPCRSAPALRP